MTPKSSRDIPTSGPIKDDERDTRKAVVRDADKTEVKNRDRVHGDGSEIGLDEK